MLRVVVPSQPNMRHRASADQARNAGALYCTTQLTNAHNTNARRILYDYDPWAGREVFVDRMVERSGISVARCVLTGDVAVLPLEVPLWMFDRLACASVRHRPSAEVDLTALSALRLLLGEVLNSVPSDHLRSSDPDLSADLMSCN